MTARLNIGSGEHPTTLPGWVNVDLPWYGVKSPHVYGSAYDLPLADGSVTAVYAGHFLEHIEWELIPQLGAELRRVMVPGAQFMCVGPDIARAVHQEQPNWLLVAILGEPPEGPGGHKWIPTEALTVAAVARLGLLAAHPVPITTAAPPRWPNVSVAEWQTAVLAVAP